MTRTEMLNGFRQVDAIVAQQQLLIVLAMRVGSSNGATYLAYQGGLQWMGKLGAEQRSKAPGDL